MNKNPNLKQESGFTLIELIMIIVILGILSSFAVEKFQDIGLEGKKSATKSALGSFRSGIAIYQSVRVVKSGNAEWPELDTLAEVGKVVIHQIPKNPFQLDTNAPDSIVTGVTKGVVVGTRGGWAYKQSTGEIWANTNTTVPGGGCSGPVHIGENSW